MQGLAERHFSKLIFGIWLFAAVAIASISREAIATWKMGDPDDQMRLLQVRDWVSGQSWWDITQYRMNGADGGAMHWSRLVDVPLGIVIVSARPFLGQAMAEQVAATVIPLLTLGIALIFYALAARRLFGGITAVMATGLLLTLMPFIMQMVPMRIDHHGWQYVCFAAALWALLHKQANWRSALILGFSCALWIEISVEGLPFAALLLGLSAFRWIYPPGASSSENTHHFPIALSSTAIGTLILFSITDSWRSPDFCDALSPVHIAALCVMAAIISLGTVLERSRPVISTLYLRLIVCGAAAVGGVVTLLAIAPACAGDAFSQLDPLVRTYWFNRTPEGLPLWAGPLDVAIEACSYLLFGGVALVYLSLRSRRLPTSDALQLVLLYAGTWAIGIFVSRTSVYAMSVANLFLAAMLLDMFRIADRRKTLLARMGLRIFALILAMPSLSASFISNQRSASAANANPAFLASERRFVAQARACQSSSAAAQLNQLPRAAIMAGIDTNPAILQFTKHNVVASGHHRNQPAMADVIRTFTGTPDQAARIISARHIRYVVICDGSYELALYGRMAREGTLAQLRAGRLPNWLERKPDIGPFQIFEVNPALLQGTGPS